MSFAILRIAKLKSWGSIASSAGHTYRTRETPNADPSRASQNVVGIGTRGDVLGDVRRRVEAVTSKPRSNAVLAIEVLLTASPEHFEGKSDQDVIRWAKANANWLRDRFGKDNVVHAVLHRDESTPHLVAYVVPEVAGRLNSRPLIGSPQLMTEMQTDYAAAMAQFGLERGLQGSKARHQTIRAYYSRLNEVAGAASARVEKLGKVEPAPDVSRWTRPGARQKAVQAWQGSETGKRRVLVREAARSALAASVAQGEVHSLKQANQALSAEVGNLREQLSQSYEALGLGKEDIAALRRSDVTAVATRLGHLGEIRPKENALDLVKRIGGFDYGQAVAWLHAEFGSTVTSAIVKKSIDADQPERPLTKAENAIKGAVLKQLDALGADRFRVSIIPESDGAKPYIPGKTAGEEERFYSREELVGLIPWLRYENNQRKHIFITPMDDAAHYILLDDARMSAHEIERLGFQPCLVQRSSWQSEQMVFKVPKSLDRNAVLAVFSEMNRTMGDEGITGLRHPFRMAGFRNMKPKHERDGQSPFVTVTQAVNRFCERCTALVEQVIRQSAGGELPEVRRTR